MQARAASPSPTNNPEFQPATESSYAPLSGSSALGYQVNCDVCARCKGTVSGIPHAGAGLFGETTWCPDKSESMLISSQDACASFSPAHACQVPGYRPQSSLRQDGPSMAFRPEDLSQQDQGASGQWQPSRPQAANPGHGPPQSLPQPHQAPMQQLRQPGSQPQQISMQQTIGVCLSVSAGACARLCRRGAIARDIYFASALLHVVKVAAADVYVVFCSC